MTTFLRHQKRSAFIAGLGTAAALYVSTKVINDYEAGCTGVPVTQGSTVIMRQLTRRQR